MISGTTKRQEVIHMNKHFKWICLLCVISLLFCSTVSPSSAQQDTVSLIPDGKGNFYWLETESGYFSVDLITNGTHSRRLIREKQSVNGGIINGSDLITYGVVYGQVCLNIINEQSSRSVMLEESAILSNGITAAGDQYIYLINPNNDHEIHVYRRWNRSDHTLSFSQPVHALFTDQTSHRPYGITTGGILDLESGEPVAHSQIQINSVQEEAGSLVYTKSCQIRDDLPDRLIISWYDSDFNYETVIERTDQ